jgi:hypothetical protein
MNSNFSGWSLAEALKRTTGLKKSDDSQFWAMLERGELVAFGRRDIDSDHEWLSAATCTSLINRDLKSSSASGKNAEDQRFIDILIYPVLHAPNAIDFLDNMAIKDAFWKFVLGDPEVRLLGNKAIKANPDLRQVYIEGRRQPGSAWEWPVEFFQGGLAGGRSKESPIGFLASSLQKEEQLAADAICDRYSALLALLRQKKIEAVGDPVRSRGSNKILSTIWSHLSYYLEVRNGDVLQKNDNTTGQHDIWLKRWCAVILQRPTFHVEPLKSDEVRSTTVESQRGLTAPSKARARVDTKMTSFHACVKWIEEIIRASPKVRTHTIKALWKMAQEKWPKTLSYRSFLKARDKAIDITDANDWRAAGLTKKSMS